MNEGLWTGELVSPLLRDVTPCAPYLNYFASHDDMYCNQKLASHDLILILYEIMGPSYLSEIQAEGVKMPPAMATISSAPEHGMRWGEAVSNRRSQKLKNLQPGRNTRVQSRCCIYMPLQRISPIQQSIATSASFCPVALESPSCDRNSIFL
jgi:hypothetical protein